MIKVSVVIPIYNVEKYLQECLNSVMCQTLKELEIICVNDGSTDHSVDIIKNAMEKDERILLIDQENRGYGAAVNAGFSKASGEYAAILEPDDYVDVEMYEKLYEKAKKYRLDMVRSDFYQFTGDRSGGELKFQRKSLHRNSEDYGVLFCPRETPELESTMLYTWNGIYRRDFLLENEIRHNETPGAAFQNHGFFLQVYTRAKRAMNLSEAYYYQRTDNPDASLNDPEKVYTIHREYDWIRDLLIENEELWDRFKYMYWSLRAENYFDTAKRIGDGYKRDFIRYISRELKAVQPSGLLKKSYYSEESWGILQLVIHDPDTYADQLLHLVKEGMSVKEVKNSLTFKTGYYILFVPKKILTLIHKIKSLFGKNI